MSYYIQLFLTRRCNQDCYYCSIYRGSSTIECDISKLKWVLNYSPKNVSVELTGGEIGLLKNLDDIIKTVYDHDNVGKIIVLSNGLVRKIGVDWLDKVIYTEHLIKDIKGTEIVKFYDLDFYHSNNIIVGTEMTIKSILFNWDYFKNTEFVTDKFKIKLMNDKTHNIKHYVVQAQELYKLLGNDRELKMIEAFKNESIYRNAKTLCSLNPPHTYIDFEDNVIGHCAVRFNVCDKVELNENNYRKLPYGTLFKQCEYCQSCYAFDPGYEKASFILKSRKGEFRNRSYK